MAAVPLFIAVAQKIAHDNTKIPEQEQLLATGAAAMNLLNAVHMLGYGAFWSTGMGTYVEDVQNALGLTRWTTVSWATWRWARRLARCRRRRVRTSVNSSRSGTVPSDRTPRASADATRRDTTRPGSGRVFMSAGFATAGMRAAHSQCRRGLAARRQGAPRPAQARQGAGPRPRSGSSPAPGPCYSGRRPRAQSRAMASDGKARDYPLGPCLVKKNAHDTIKRGDNL